MATFRCGRFPAGTAHIRTAAGDLVKFVDGVAHVDDPQTADGLRGVPDDFEITEDPPVQRLYTLDEVVAEFGVVLPVDEDPPHPPPESSEPELTPQPDPTYEPEDAETVTVTAADIRKWAKENGVDCPGKGKIPQAVADAYLAAHVDN